MEVQMNYPSEKFGVLSQFQRRCNFSNLKCASTLDAMSLPPSPQKYANETVWYTFFQDAEKREYSYEPRTRTAKWVKSPHLPNTNRWMSPPRPLHDRRTTSETTSCSPESTDRSCRKRNVQQLGFENEACSPSRDSLFQAPHSTSSESLGELTFTPCLQTAEDRCFYEGFLQTIRKECNDTSEKLLAVLTDHRVASAMLAALVLQILCLLANALTAARVNKH
jgi:hypothetical protein